MGFTGVTPPAIRTTGDGGLTTMVDKNAQNPLGQVAFYKDANDRWSVLKYVCAQATITLGDTLMKCAGAGTCYVNIGATLTSTLNGRNPGVVAPATTGMALYPNACAGVAAANVSNTGYYFWSYIAGYCPSAAMPSLYASGQPLRLSGTYTGRLSSAAINASQACTGATAAAHMFAFSLGALTDYSTASTANSTNSVMLNGWYM